MPRVSVALLVLPGLAFGQARQPRDVSVTSLGLQQTDSFSVDRANEAPGADIRFFLGERLRWTVGSGDGQHTVQAKALADARFTFDPRPGFDNDGQNFETNNVRQLGMGFRHRSFSLSVGRHPVYRGGPRLVDGVQLLGRPSPEVDVGFWGGLAPDFFETDLRVRPGFGPVLAYTGSQVQASVVGDVAFFEGNVDHAGVLAMGRWAGNRLVEVSGRLDLELASGSEGEPHLSDFQVFSVLTPVRELRFDLLYNAFSSYRYITSAEVDPEQQRFAQRLEQLGRDLGIVQIEQDPTVNHLVGASVRYRGTGDGVRPRAELMARYRHNVLPEDRFARLSPTLGLGNLGGRVDLLVNGNLIRADADDQFDLGLMTVVEASDTVSVDASARLLSVPDYGRLGFYADAFVDVVATSWDVVIISGVSYLVEPDGDQRDGGPGVFVRLAKYLRPARRAGTSAPAPTPAPVPDSAPL